MKIGDLVEQLQELKLKYPILTNDEILKLYQLQLLSVIAERLN